MTTRNHRVRLGIVLLSLAVLLSIALAFASPAAASNVEPADYEYDASELLTEESVTRSDRLTLTPNGTATEGNTIRIELDDDRSEFEIAAVADATGDEIGISTATTGEAIVIELTDLNGRDELSETTISVDVDLVATDAAAGSAGTYDSTPVATVTADEAGGNLVGESVMRVSIDGQAEIAFDADTIDETAKKGYLPVRDDSRFTLEFSDGAKVGDGDSINISIDPENINKGDSSGFAILYAWESATQNKNISSIDVTTSGDANVLDGHDDQITVTIHTVDGEPKLVSGEAVAIGIQLSVETESMKRAADRYRSVDFLTVDVEGENNARLTHNDDVRTESPVILDVYPGEASSDGFELGGIESGDEFGIAAGRILTIDGLEDRFGNEIPAAKVDVTLSGNDDYAYDGIRTETDGTNGMAVEEGGDIDARLGAFDLSVEVIDVPGPATQSRNTGPDVTEQVSDVTVYPDDVALTTTAAHDDFDVGGEVRIEIEVDLGVPDERIDRVDLELRRESGAGTVSFDGASGSPTATDPWGETGYGGDDHLGQENAWMIERGLTSRDFEGGTRRYVLDADVADRYDIGVAVMPYEERLVPDASGIETSLAEDPGAANRGRTEVVATGPIDAISNVSVPTDYEFVGVESDEGTDVVVELTGFEDANGNAVTNTDETVTVRFGETVIDEVGPTGTDAAATTRFDPTAIDGGAIETGTDADIAIGFADGNQRNETDVTFVHRAIERSSGSWRAGSIPQPATLYVDADGPRDLAQWNPETGTYDGIASNGSSDTLESHRIGHDQLHRGYYAYAEGDEGGIRIGFEYATSADESIGTESIELDSGWHFGSSNYDVSAHTQRDLEADANWVEADFGDADGPFVIWDERRSDRLHDSTAGIDVDGSDEPIEHDDAYWIRIEDSDDTPVVRRIVSPTFSEDDGGAE